LAGLSKASLGDWIAISRLNNTMSYPGIIMHFKNEILEILSRFESRPHAQKWRLIKACGWTDSGKLPAN
jgi:hypothetical protein